MYLLLFYLHWTYGVTTGVIEYWHYRPNTFVLGLFYCKKHIMRNAQEKEAFKMEIVRYSIELNEKKKGCKYGYNVL